MTLARSFKAARLVLLPLLLLSACASAASDSDQLAVTEDVGSLTDIDQSAGSEATNGEATNGEATATSRADEEDAGPADDVDKPAVEGVAATSGVDLDVLPVRSGAPEETTGGVPHIQTSATRNTELTLELTRRAYDLPGLENRESIVSLPGAQSLWLSDELELARPEVLAAGREFGHIHPDSSMHLWLPVDRALEVAENGWGELHPWVERDGFWDGVVMVWAPESDEDAAVSFRLIVDAFNFVTGQNLDAVDFQ